MLGAEATSGSLSKFGREMVAVNFADGLHGGPPPPYAGTHGHGTQHTRHQTTLWP